MKAKKFFSLLLVLVICLNSVSMTAMAAESEPHTKANVARATGRFSMDVPGGALVKASVVFPLGSRRDRDNQGNIYTVFCKRRFWPDRTGRIFLLSQCRLNADDGSFDETIKVDERGNYTFAVQNNSSKAVSVSGYVNY